MARIFVTGSSTGLGLLAGQRLAREGHAVVLHARNERRADDARQALRSAEDVIVGDLQTIRGAVDLAEKGSLQESDRWVRQKRTKFELTLADLP
jgi:NAD(P)-dependent dehydrogenase (short-subunit alcohol dehydrogenase family)